MGQALSKRWYVVYTNIRCEKRARDGLKALGYDVYLPLHKREVVHHRRKVVMTKEFPLFTRYLFLALPDGSGWHKVRATDGVESVLGVDGQPMPVDEACVNSFRDAQNTGLFDQMRPINSVKLKKNETVKIIEGPFSGFYAKVQHHDGRKLVNVMAEMFKGKVPMQIPLDHVRRAA